LWARYQQTAGLIVQEPEPQNLVAAEMGRLSAVAMEPMTSVSDAIHSTLATLQKLAARQRISLAASVPPDLPPVSVDRVVLRQTLLNTLSHMFHRGVPGAIEITAGTEGRFVWVFIHYQPCEDCAVMPQGSFVEQDNRLAIASRLIGMQGGRMEVSGEGESRVVLSLPARRPRTVLVIDDNPDMIQLFRRYLGGGMYHVIGATESGEALRLAREIQPHVITLDVMMPSQDGWEILQNLKSHPETKRIPVIVCSVLQERELALSLGAAEVLVKPITQQMLLSALERCGASSGGAEHPGSL
ncbi:MAG: response regulator, partial [Anaerolineae bacterium]|nr:response regulator [Anaerolineae bacterium]